TASFTTSHIAVRACDFRGDENTGGFGSTSWTPNSVENIVFYANRVHDNGIWDPLKAQGDRDIGTYGVGAHVSSLWIVDNEMCRNEGDGVQISAGSLAAQSTTHHIYVGRNIAHHNKQCGFWTKQSVDTIFSQNHVFGIRRSTSAAGPGMGFQYAPERVWFLFNTIEDCEYGFFTGSDSGMGSVRQSYFIGNLIYDIHYDAAYHPIAYEPADAWSSAGIMTAGGVNRHFIGNTIHDASAGINVPGSGGSVYAANNIIANIGTQREHHIWVENIGSNTTFRADNNLLYQPDGMARIKWGDALYNAATFPAVMGAGNRSANPTFVETSVNFALRVTSPAMDAGTSSGTTSEVFALFEKLYGIDIRTDIEGKGRPQGSAWDIGAVEYANILKPVGDLRVSQVVATQNSVTVTWTVPGAEDGGSGTCGYDLRYSTSPLTEEAWVTATQVQGEPVPATVGSQQWFTITGLNAGVMYYIAVKTQDQAGHTSSISNVVSAMTTTAGNHAPVLTPIGDRSIAGTATLTFAVHGADADGDTLTYAAAGLPAGASFTAATQMFSWTTTSSQVGMHHVAFQISDGQVMVSETITITVSQAPNHAPVLDPIGDKSVSVNTPLSFSVSATDADGDSLTYSASGLPSGAGFANQLFSWTPASDQAGALQVTFTVSDGEATDSEQITMTVPDARDTVAPSVQAVYPAAGAVQVPANPLIALTISDSGMGIDAASVAIRVNDQLVYTGGESLYESVSGVCRRVGTRANYRYYYHPAEAFDYDQPVVVHVNASDAAGNLMTPVSYQFVTEMRAFGHNESISSGNDSSGHPGAATDSHADVWAVWHAGQVGARAIYTARRDHRTGQWSSPV
ncbi:MAG: hypothetical protein EHM35_07280, partial [Planctomycetaceae bacterium]